MEGAVPPRDGDDAVGKRRDEKTTHPYPLKSTFVGVDSLKEFEREWRRRVNSFFLMCLIKDMKLRVNYSFLLFFSLSFILRKDDKTMQYILVEIRIKTLIIITFIIINEKIEYLLVINWKQEKMKKVIDR